LVAILKWLALLEIGSKNVCATIYGVSHGRNNGCRGAKGREPNQSYDGLIAGASEGILVMQGRRGRGEHCERGWFWYLILPRRRIAVPTINIPASTIDAGSGTAACEPNDAPAPLPKFVRPKSKRQLL
jgi:hypothetical protein